MRLDRFYVASGAAIACFFVVADARAQGMNCKGIATAPERLACYDKAFGVELREKAAVQKPDSSGKIPEIKDFSICNPKDLYMALRKALPTKSQFETSADFASRSRSALASSGVATTNILCAAASGRFLEYDADRKRLKAFFLSPSVRGDEKIEGVYQGQNAYGASAQITRKTSERYEINTPYIDHEIFVPLDPASAQAQFSDLRMAMLGDVHGQIVKESSYTSTPTITSPTEERTTTYEVMYLPKAFILYNEKTKAVLWSAKMVECRRYSWSDDKEWKIGKCDRN